MLKAICRLLFVISIIFHGQSESAAKKKVPVVFYSNLTSYKIEPNNNVIKDQGNHLIQWQSDVKEGANGLMVYYIDNDGKEHELEDLCKKESRTSFPRIIKQFLGVNACPIQKETLSLITTDYSRPATQTKGECEDDIDLILKLKSKKTNKFIMTLNVKMETLSLNSCN